MRTFAAFLLILLIAAACGDDSDEAATTTTSSTTTSTTSTSLPSTTLTPTPELLTLGQSCQSPDGFSISYPTEWEAVSDCGQFGPAPVEEPERATDERTGVVSAYVDPVPFKEASQSIEGEQSRAVSTVDGLQAVRAGSRSTGEGLYPAGTASVTWMVDLSVGMDDEPATLSVNAVNAVNILDDVDFDRAVTTMDRMVRSLDLTADDAVDVDNVVARYEGGGAPFTVAVAAAATQPATCLRLVDGDGIACVEAVDSNGDVALTRLDGPAGPITVGITSPDVFAIELSTSERTMTFLPVTYPARNSLAFALPVEPADLDSVILRAVDGTVIAQPDPAAARRPAGG